MTSYLHYPKYSSSLNDIAQTTCIKPEDSDNYCQRLAEANKHIPNINNQYGNSPIFLPNSDTPQAIHTPLCTAPGHDTLKHLSHYAGGAATMALADLLWEAKIPGQMGDITTAFGGAGAAGTYTANHVLSSIAEYDKALKEYENLRNHRAAPARKQLKKAELDRAYKKMNQIFNQKGQQILHKHAFKTKEVLNRRGRVVRESIPVSNNADVQKLAGLAKIGRVVGPGLILLDGYVRANGVYHSYREHDPRWKRQAITQGVSFIGGIAAAGAIGFFIAISPLGIVAGLLIGAAAALTVDHSLKIGVGMAYDKVF